MPASTPEFKSFNRGPVPKTRLAGPLIGLMKFLIAAFSSGGVAKIAHTVAPQTDRFFKNIPH